MEKISSVFERREKGSYLKEKAMRREAKTHKAPAED